MKKKKEIKIITKTRIVSLILILLAFLAPLHNIIKLLILIFTLILLSLEKRDLLPKNKKKLLPLYALIYLIVFILLDSICVVTLHKIPVFTLSIVTKDNVRVHNALGYKVWQCNKNNSEELVIEPFYRKGYACDIDDIDNVNINDLITSLNNNFDEYRNTYVKVTGKISKKDGQNYIEMQAYQENEESMNGYVTFSETITLAIMFSENTEALDVYDIYDEITVVGLIKNMESIDGKRTIYMYEAKLTSIINLNTYTITATRSKKCKEDKKLIYETTEDKIYTYCLEDIIVKYNDDNLEYELPSVLSSNKLDINTMIDNHDSKKTNKYNKNILYKYYTYNILVCDKETSKDVIIMSPKLDFDDVKCTIVE